MAKLITAPQPNVFTARAQNDMIKTKREEIEKEAVLVLSSREYAYVCLTHSLT